MKIQYTTTPACAAMLHGASSDAGSSLHSLRSAGMFWMAESIEAARRLNPQRLATGTIDTSDIAADYRGFAGDLRAMVILHFHRSIRRKNLRKWMLEVKSATLIGGAK